MAYEGLLFSFAKMESEIENLRLSAEAFLERESFDRLIPQWKRDLITFRGRPPGTSSTWQIHEQQPFQTILSDGKFDRKAGLRVFARISGIWELFLPKENPNPKKGSLRDNFVLNGLASTRISIWKLEGAAETEIARWTVEVGDAVSPGCHFHSQIPLEEEGCGMFPKSLPIPRLPTLLVTPMDALEFALAELFQKDWQRHSSKNTNSQKIWASCQRRRLENLLKWYLECIKSSTGPWTALKLGKPARETLSK